MSDFTSDLFLEDNEGPICRPISVGVTETMEEKVAWLKKVKRVDVNKFMRIQLQNLIEKAERGELDKKATA